ncbi:MAG: hypothetical protein J0M04_19545 [Verrucomicrobia bacterium]|nr:hypothetical protein [Verrucomicrobiota bacterium]
MSPALDDMLVNEVVPRLRAVARTIPKIGAEDDEDIVQDATLMAARMMESAEKSGHPITAGNATYYAVKAARSGRRSGYTGRCDVYSPGCQIDGNARFDPLDATMEVDDEPCGTLHDVIRPFDPGDREIDPAEEAARNLDWEAFLAGQPPRQRRALRTLAEGGTMREAGKQCGIRDSAALKLKRRIAADLVAFFGEAQIRRLLEGRRPDWEAGLRCARERHACQCVAFVSWDPVPPAAA